MDSPYEKTPLPAGSVGSTGRWGVQVEHLWADSAVVRAVGIIDAETAPHIDRRLGLAIQCVLERPVHILLDLSGVIFLDQSGLGTLLHFQDLVESGGGTIQLLNPTPAEVRLLHETHLDGASRRPGA